ncbi:MAG: hypothetical protein ACFCUI_03880, partial [Bernardetiaceae bacterium]
MDYDRAYAFFKANEKLLHRKDHQTINAIIEEISGIRNFFPTQESTSQAWQNLKNAYPTQASTHKKEYGDFQTNYPLAKSIADEAFRRCDPIAFVLEPTCGKGNFILACLHQQKPLQKIVGIDIHPSYVWEAKLNVLCYFLANPTFPKPEIDLIQANAFTFDYTKLAQSTVHLRTLVIGNPPWVTNADLGAITSKNLPKKSNIKNHKGIDAITGKGNFDVGEYLSLSIIQKFQYHNGLFAFLLKSSVIRNILYNQKKNHFKIGHPEQLTIDAKRE